MMKGVPHVVRHPLCIRCSDLLWKEAEQALL